MALEEIQFEKIIGSTESSTPDSGLDGRKKIDRNFGKTNSGFAVVDRVKADHGYKDTPPKTLSQVEAVSKVVFSKETSFPIVGLYTTSNNEFDPSANWRSAKIDVKDCDIVQYHVYSLTGANLITFVDDRGVYISSIPAIGGTSSLPTPKLGEVIVPPKAAMAYISTHNTLVAQSFYGSSTPINQMFEKKANAGYSEGDNIKTLKDVDVESKLTEVQERNFAIKGVYMTKDNAFEESNSWNSAKCDVSTIDFISWNIFSVDKANIITFFDVNNIYISSIPATGSDLNAPQSGGVGVPANASIAYVSTHNTHLDLAYYSVERKISEVFAEHTNELSILGAKIDTIIVEPRILTVSKTASPNETTFNQIADSVEAYKDGDWIYIHEGTYDEVGINLPDLSKVKGIGNVVINGELDVTASTKDIDDISTLDLFNNGRIENITILARNMRYPIHSDFSKGNTRQDIVNCRFIHHGNYDVWKHRTDNESSQPDGEKAKDVFRGMSAWGGGTRAGDVRHLKGCYFESDLRGFSTHNNVNFDKTHGASIVILEDCEFVSHGIDFDGSNIGFLPSIVIQSLISNTDDLVIMINCRINGYLCYHGALTHNVICDTPNLKTVYNSLGSGKGMNDQIGLIDVTRYAKVKGETNNFKNLSTIKIPRGYAVKQYSYGIGLMTSSDNADLFLGVAMQDIEINKCGDVTTQGYLIRPYLDGLTNIKLAEGDKVSVTATGSFEKSSAHPVCTVSDNQNVKIGQ